MHSCAPPYLICHILNDYSCWIVAVTVFYTVFSYVQLFIGEARDIQHMIAAYDHSKESTDNSVPRFCD